MIALNNISFADKALLEQIGLEQIWGAAIALNLPVALWRLPGEKTTHLIIDLTEQITPVTHRLEDMPAGFVVNPFVEAEAGKWLIKAHLHYRTTTDGLQLSCDPALGVSEQKLKEQLHQIAFGKEALPVWPSLLVKQTITEQADAQARYTNLVSRGIAAIRQGDFQKVVLSRRKPVALTPDFSVFDTYQKLCSFYTNAFVSAFYLPKIGLWMNASPELLIRVDKRRFFHTLSLAGTQPMREGITPGTAQWMQKEIEEQAMVSRYIIECFKKIRLREYVEAGPKTVMAGNLLHLRTEFSVDMEATNFPQLGSVMLELLHPTSAVCGMPKQAALDFILAGEGYQREFYSGYCGPVNIDAETNLFVNLRCMQLTPGQAILYAGAGVTEDSVPEKEWLETELKCETMLRALRQCVPY